MQARHASAAFAIAVILVLAPLSAVASESRTAPSNTDVLGILAGVLKTLSGFIATQSDNNYLTISGFAASTPATTQTLAQASRIDTLSNVSISGAQISNATVSGLTGLTTSMLGDFSYATTSSYGHIAAWGDSITMGYGGSPSFPTDLSFLTGYSVFNGGRGGDTSTQILTRMLAAGDKRSWPTIIWAGRNNYTDPTSVKADIASMVASLGHSHFIVLSILNGASEGATTTAYAQIAALNNDLASTYGNHYLDIRSYLVSQYNPNNPEDVVDFAADVPPASLRYDFLHPNTTGYSKIAQYLQGKLGLIGISSDNAILTSQNLAQFALTPPSFGFVNTLGGYQLDGTIVLTASSTNFSTYVGLGTGSLNTANWNTGVGYQALYSATSSASANDAFGFQSLYYNTSGTNNNAYGVWSLFHNTTGSSNIAHGGQALFNNTTGANNTAVGFAPMQTNTTGSQNVALGYNASYYNNSATNTVAIGYQAALGNFSNYSAQGSVAIGWGAGKKFGTGSDYNVLLGYSAGGNITSGAGNIWIGSASTTANSNITTGYANIAIGNNIKLPSATGNYQLNVGNLIYGTNLDGTGTTLSTGSIGIGSTTPWRKFAVTGSVGFDGLTGSTGAGSLCLSANREVVYNSASDSCLPSLRALKHDIAPLAVNALSQIAALQPVSFIYNDDASSTTRYGFIAEDTAGVDPHLATYNEIGAISGVDDRALISIAVKALQQLIGQVTELANRLVTKELVATNVEAEIVTAHQKLCVGSTCVTEDQLRSLLNQAGQQPASVPQSSQPSPPTDQSTTTVSDAPSIAPDASSSLDTTTQEATTTAQ